MPSGARCLVSAGLAANLITVGTAPAVLALEFIDGLIGDRAHDDSVAEVDHDHLAGIPAGACLGRDGHLAISGNGHHVTRGCHAVIVYQGCVVV